MTVRIAIPIPLTRNRLERENYSLSHNGRWDIGNSELKFYGEKVDKKYEGQSGTITFGKHCHRRQVMSCRWA
ncbi:ferric iron-catecholate outer membrane transporter [Klebsiella pneumoniae]|uniref:Ferric iron-catecholate outer membrane transporter n=1 Tax=Klebsiella pneumoniae TaxID=573 RepID=A0A2X3IT14_KLEPN|nr:ferric iron-catecholate outer membrane transporter [Klebsiella pneumoniae]